MWRTTKWYREKIRCAIIELVRQEMVLIQLILPHFSAPAGLMPGPTFVSMTQMSMTSPTLLSKTRYTVHLGRYSAPRNGRLGCLNTWWGPWPTTRRPSCWVGCPQSSTWASPPGQTWAPTLALTPWQWRPWAGPPWRWTPCITTYSWSCSATGWLARARLVSWDLSFTQTGPTEPRQVCQATSAQSTSLV